MKQCPKCSKQYADEAYFCLQDGTPLVSAVAANDATPNSFAPVSTPFQPWSQQPPQPQFQQAQGQQAQAPPNVDAANVGATNSNSGRLKSVKKACQLTATLLLIAMVLLWGVGIGKSFVFFGLFVIEIILVGVIFFADKSQKS